MKHPLSGVLLSLAASLLVGATAQAALPAMVDGEKVPSLAPMIKTVSPAVVNIAVRGSVEVRRGANPFFDDPRLRRFFNFEDDQPRRRNTQSAGSGVIIDAKNGYILTNHHVVADAEEIEVTLLDNTVLSGSIVGSDPLSDVAVIEVDSKDLEEISFADSDDVEVGDFVVAIGNPFGFGHTVTSGIVSALGRSGLSRGSYEDFIQTDASINPGNSGGALINLRGELIGINSAIISNSGGNLGIGFAIPVNMARSVLDQILEYGEVRRGLLGVNIFAVTPAVAEAYDLTVSEGALVSEVSPGSAADKAGVLTGDVVTAVNGEPVKNHTELRNAIGLMRIGDKVDLDIVRDGKEKMITAKLGAANPEPEQIAAADVHEGLAGAELETLGPGDSQIEDLEGVLVTSVERGSPAALRGLRRNDVITHVNRRPISNVAELRDRADDARSLGLTVRRGNSELLLPIL
ncbi:MAG: DegQ family serine endoprotease [Pseudomonadota bacterium]